MPFVHARLGLPAVVLAAALKAPAAALADDGHADALADLSLEQLREIVITSLSRRDERLDGAAASAYVITGDAIRRSGATTLPEALRLAPNLDVARIDASRYAISARGFNAALANQMLVMIDGRTVYTPLFSGVFWEAQQVPLDDVERIEVISGPGSALWGTNAVNGLIHVFTRSAAQAQGPAAFAHLGTHRRAVFARHGGALPTAGGNAHYRLYAQAWDHDGFDTSTGTPARDANDGVQLGFRADWQRGADALTLQGDAYASSVDAPAQAAELDGAHLLARWQRHHAGGAHTTLQVYFDRARRDQPGLFEETVDTVDAVAQVALPAGPRHALLLGGGVRRAHDDTSNGPVLAFIPADRGLHWWRLFAQDQVTLADTLALTLAASVEHDPYTGAQALPSARLAWAADPRHLLWAALSRAARAPARIDREFFVPAQPPFQIAGGPDFRAELADVLEVGLRAQPTPALSYQLTLFHHEHQRLRSLRPTPGGIVLANDIEGSTGGLEAWAQWHVSERWRLDAGVVALRHALRVRDGAVDAGGLAALRQDPDEWASLRSSFALTPSLQWELSLRHAGARPDVPSYRRVDSRLAWRLPRDAELALKVDNLLDDDHSEFFASNQFVELPRRLAVQLRWPLR